MGTSAGPRHWPQVIYTLAFCLIAVSVVAGHDNPYYASPPFNEELPPCHHLPPPPPFPSPPPPYIYKFPPPTSPSPPPPCVYKSLPPPSPSPPPPYIYKFPPPTSLEPCVVIAKCNSPFSTLFRSPINCDSVHASSTKEVWAMLQDWLVRPSSAILHARFLFGAPWIAISFMHPPPTSMEPCVVIA